MTREFRYIVLKYKDAYDVLTNEEFQLLSGFLDKIEEHRITLGKGALEAVVVESDWPEYQHVWDMISQRMENSEG